MRRFLLVVGALVVLSLLGLGGSQTEAYSTSTALAPHEPIVIDGDKDFTPANGVVRGTGTQDDPYVISGWEIEVPVALNAVRIQNTIAHFVIRSCKLSGAIEDGILLYNVKHAQVEN